MPLTILSVVLPDAPGQPVQTAAAGADTILTFGVNGNAPFYHCSIQNNTSANVFYAFDQDSTSLTGKIYTLTPNQYAFWDRFGYKLHFSSAAQHPFGGQSGITVEVFA